MIAVSILDVMRRWLRRSNERYEFIVLNERQLRDIGSIATSFEAKQQSHFGINEGMIMDRKIRFATKNDFLYACVVLAVLAVLVVTAFGLFREVTEVASMH